MAQTLNVSVVTVRRLISKRQIPFHVVGRQLRFAEKDITHFLECNRVELVSLR